jgi:hypothetical protein
MHPSLGRLGRLGRQACLLLGVSDEQGSEQGGTAASVLKAGVVAALPIRWEMMSSVPNELSPVHQIYSANVTHDDDYASYPSEAIQVFLWQ